MNIQAIAMASAFFVGVLTGHIFTKHYYDNLILEMSNAALKADAVNLVKQRETEQNYIYVQNATEQSVKSDLDTVNRMYERALAYSVLKSEGSNNTTKVSNTAPSTSKTADTCNCGRIRQNLEVVRKHLIEIAKERDTLAIERNECVKLYESVSN